jgi:hypothetical protein
MATATLQPFMVIRERVYQKFNRVLCWFEFDQIQDGTIAEVIANNELTDTQRTTLKRARRKGAEVVFVRLPDGREYAAPITKVRFANEREHS